jgi:EAL domain-containing protein (putative c-di-GMP-specific phosphodiesterase class I)/GGDEF domain-containing protein
VSRLRVAAIPTGSVILAAGGLLAWALPTAWRFLPHAPGGFWIMAGLACVVDAPMFGSVSRALIRPRSTLSTCVAIAIFLLWGPGAAILVQTAAAATSVVLRHYERVTGFGFVARHILALGAVIGVVTWFRIRPAVWPALVRGPDLPSYLTMALVWAGTSFLAFVIFVATIRGQSVGAAWRIEREDLFVTTASNLAILPLLVTIDVRWSALVAVPLFARSSLSRFQLRQARRETEEPSTGLLTRLGLVEAIDELTFYDRLRDPAPFGVILLDTELALSVNRSLGREYYDKLVAQSAERLIPVYGRRHLGVLPVEGFVLLIAGLTSSDAIAEGTRAVSTVDTLLEIDGIPFVAETAGGVALSPEHGRDLTTLINRAALAAREARRTGAPVALFVEREDVGASRRVALLAEFRAALLDPGRAQEVAILYQPQVNIGTGQLVGVEALLRWTHPDWGPVPTDELVDAVETSEVVRLLTQRVLETATAQVRAWNERGLTVRVAFNASVRDLRDPAFVDEVGAAVERYGIQPAQLTVEITERIATGEDLLVARSADRIAELGVGLSIDDFGTGHASLRELRSLPVTELKIDRAYVSTMVSDPADRAIVTSVHQLARALRLDVIAEGVEDEPMVRALAELPGVIGQGWYFGRPMTADDLERWQDQRDPRPIGQAQRSSPS